MTERRRLPYRRPVEVIEFENGGIHYLAGIGRFADGSVAEIFLDGPKIGSAAQIAARDAAICASLCLQHGVTADDLLHSLERNPNGEPRGPLGKALSVFGPK
jgi:ribonucleoside-diphosphate reductase alpha chain